MADVFPANTPGLVREAARRLAAGELIIYPTDTVYGIGAAAGNDDAIRRVFVAKGRPPTKALPLLIAETAAAAWAAEVPQMARALTIKFWPGPLTIVMPKHPDFFSLALAKQKTVALRVPDNGLTRDIIATLGQPITGTSANRSGARSATSAQEAAFGLGNMVSLVIDDGKLSGGQESTVIDITRDPPVVLREGPVTREELRQALGRDVA